MEEIKLLFSDYTFQIVALGSVLLGLVSGILGSFAVLKKQSLLGDGISHAALPGVVAAFLLTGSKNTEVLLLGALLAGLMATLMIHGIVKHSRIHFDSALALVMSVFFGLGMVLLTYVQKLPNANQAGLKRFIYGQASTMLLRDVRLIAVCGVVLLFVVLLFWKEFKLFLFDPAFGVLQGFGNKKMNLMLSFLLVMGIIIGLQTVGVVLMSAMLITPAVAARQWSDRFWLMTMLTALFGGISGMIGTIVSAIFPKIPTGPVIVVTISAIACFSLLFAPGRGILHKMYTQSRNKARLLAERRDCDAGRI